MWTFDALISVANTQKVQLEEQLYSNNILKTLLLQQGLHISSQQVNVQQELFHENLFRTIKLPYYNLVDFPTHVFKGYVSAFMPICVTHIKKNDLLLKELFVNKIFDLEYVKQCTNAKNSKHVFLKCFSLEEAYEKIINWVNNIDHEDITKIKMYIQIFYQRMQNIAFKRYQYGHPFIKQTCLKIQEQMLPPKQSWQSNINTCTVAYTFDNISGSFQLLYSIQKIHPGHRLLYAITKEKQLSLSKQIRHCWPIVLQIDHLLYLPRQLWNLYVNLDGEPTNLFSVLKNNPNWFIAQQVSFRIDRLSRKYYDIMPLGTIENKYNILICTSQRGIIRPVQFELFNSDKLYI